MKLQHICISTPLGPVQISGSAHHLQLIRFVDQPVNAECEQSIEATRLSNHVNKPLTDNTIHANGRIVEVARQLLRYFQGNITKFNLTEIPEGTTFQQAVWKIISLIPFGKTRTYVSIAKELGDTKKTRAVGSAVGANPLLVFIPCHRVISSNGKLTGYAGGINRKQWLLKHEHQILTGQKTLF